MPVTIVGGLHDAEVSAQELLGWKRFTTNAFREHWLDAGHWLLDEALDPLAAILDGEAAVLGDGEG